MRVIQIILICSEEGSGETPTCWVSRLNPPSPTLSTGRSPHGRVAYVRVSKALSGQGLGLKGAGTFHPLCCTRPAPITGESLPRRESHKDAMKV